MSISFVMICFVCSLGDFKSKIKKEYTFLLIMTITCYLLSQDKPFLTTSMFKNLNCEFDTLAANIKSDEVYFTANTRLATTLKFVYNKPVYYIDISHHMLSGRTENIVDELKAYMQKNDYQINYIGSINELGQTDISYKEIFQYTMSTIDLKSCVAEFPREIYQLEIPANVYVLSLGLD